MNLSQMFFRHISYFARLILIVVVASSAIKAQTGGVDLSFNAVPEKNATSPINFILQPNNKIIVFGNFQIVNGIVRNQIARFNADGSLDATFNCATCDFNISNALLQPDGKIVVSGSINFPSPGVVYRLNSDGSRDASFTSPFSVGNGNNSAFVNAIQPDGKILVTQSGSIAGFSVDDLYRLNLDGTFDTTFTRIGVGAGRLVRTIPQKISVAPDGKIFVATNTTNAGNSTGDLRRYNADGTVDSIFEPPVLVGAGGTPDFRRSSIADFDIQSDGRIMIVGSFVTVNGVSRQNVVRLLPGGNVDLSFNSSNLGELTRVKVLSDGKVVVSTNSRFFRLNADGSSDNSFASPTNITLINNWMLDSAGRIVLYGTLLEDGVSISRFARLNQDGSLESSFTAAFGVVGSVTAIAAQSDGKVIFAGDFNRVNGVPRISIARVNADGSLDPTFNTEIGINSTISKILVQSDGKILVAGYIRFIGRSPVVIVRLNQDGSLDSAFNPNLAASARVDTVALQSDGKIFIGGGFDSVNGQTRTSIARLNSDGSLDASFNPVFGSASIRSIVVQSDGKIMVGGLFSGVNGFSRTNLVRLNADGTLDTSFNAGNISAVNQIEVLADGKYLVLTNTILRLNNNGTSDPTFLVPTFSSSNSNSSAALYQFLVQPDGSIIIGGNFTTFNNAPRTNFVRLQPNGALDTNFFPSGANGTVRTIVRRANGQILVGGDFSIIGGVTRLSIARLNVSSFRLTTPFDFDGDGRADVSVFRPSNGFWYELRGQNNAFFAMQFGQASDRIAPADYDGDGRTDIAVFRGVVPGAGNAAYFYITRSSDNSFVPVQFGATGDVPVSGDWDGDGKGDLAVYRDGSLAGGQSYFYYRPSSQPSVNFNTIQFGITGDKPLVGDFDGDGRLDPAVFRPFSATWIILKSSLNQTTQTAFGLPTDIPAPADFNGDGQANLAVFRPSNGFWYIARPTGIASQNFDAVQFGANGDKPVPADYDGDGRADVAVFRPSNGSWYILRSSEGLTGVQFGTSEDQPVPSAYIY